MNYYVESDGQRYGPADIPLLQQWIREGRLSASMMVSDAATGATIPASQVPGLIFSTPPPAGNTAPPPVGPATSATGSPWPGAYGSYEQPPGPQSYPHQPVGPYYRPSPGQSVQAPLTKAILCTLFCCMPLGIVSIVYASQAMGHNTNGNYQAARDAADKANIWGNWSLGLGLAYVVVVLIAMFATESSSSYPGY